MYTKPFFIKKPVGNNAFSYDERKNKKLYVPSLIEIDDLEKIELQPHPQPLSSKEMGDYVAFEDFDFDGKLSTNFGLKNFYKIDRPHLNPILKGEGIKQTIYLFDNHNHAYFFWYLARSEGIIGDNNLLYHIDEHADTRDSGEYLMKPDSYDLTKVFDFTNFVLNVGNYIVPAVEEGIIGKVVQIRNESNLLEYENLYLSNIDQYSTNLDHPLTPSLVMRGNDSIILNLDLDFFQPDLDYIDYELKKKVVLDIAKNASIITVSTSPFFINQELAINVFKDIFGGFFNK